MKKILFPLLAVTMISSAFAADQAVVGIPAKCVLTDGPISFVAKNASVDSVNIRASVSSSDQISNSSLVNDDANFSNRSNEAISDAHIDLKMNSETSELTGTINLTALRKQVLNAGLAQKGYPEACVSGIEVSIAHDRGIVDGGTVKLLLNNDPSTYALLQF